MNVLYICIMLCMSAISCETHFTDDEQYVLKKIWENLAEKHDGYGISKEIFIQYVQLNGVLEEVLFEQFDIKKLSYIDYDDFITTMNIICFGSTTDHAKFLFDMCTHNSDAKSGEKVVKKDMLSLLLHSMPSELLCLHNIELNDYINNIFLDNEYITCDKFEHWIETVPKIMAYIKEHIPYNIDNNLKRRQSVDKLDMLPKTTENVTEHESWLYKKCKRLGLLKKQYYFLHGSCLYYYNSKFDLKPRGIIYLVGSLIKPLAYSHRNLLAFEITQLDLCSGDHNIHETRVLYCDNEAVRSDWVNKLQTASHMALFEDKYMINYQQKLGCGAFSDVYACIDNTFEKYAVKIINKQKFSQEDKEHFRTEINILKMLRHKNIINTYDIFETKETISIVTELVADGEFFNFVIGKPCFKDDDLRPLMQQLLECVGYLHDLGIVHSDIKPENILYNCSTKQIKLIDFGLSKILLPNQKIEQVCGTISYVAPEALQFNAYGCASDIWSIGVIMYLLVYGRLPFDGEGPNETDQKSIIIYNIMTQPIELKNTKSRHANLLISKLLEKDQKMRLTAQHALNEPFFHTHILSDLQLSI